MNKQSKKNNRIGNTNITNQGYEIKIIKYRNANDIDVLFVKDGFIVEHTFYESFKNGSIKNPFHKTVYNRGYLGIQSNRKSIETIKNKKSYKIWNGIMTRCYNDNYKNTRPTYDGCYVCDEWLCYANFEKWFNENYYEIKNEKMCLDKDILKKGNKIYSPQTCVFVPNRINCLFTKNNKNRSICIGVTKRDKKYVSTVSIMGKNRAKFFETKEEAFFDYKKRKEQEIKRVAEEYKENIPNILFNAMINYKVEYTD